MASTSPPAFTAMLENSRLARPCLDLIRTPSEALFRAYQHSALGGWIFKKLLSGSAEETEAPRTWRDHGLDGGLLLGVLALFALLEIASTTQIGVGVWVLAGWATVSALILRRQLGALVHRLSILDIWVIGFFLTAIVAAAFSSYRHEALIGLAKLITYAVAYKVFRYLLFRRAWALAVGMGMLVLLGTVEAWVGFEQFFNGVDPLATWSDQSIDPTQQMTRVFGTFDNPNLLAGFLVPCLAASAGLMLLAASQKKTLKFAFILAVLTAAMVGTMVLTGSRGGYLAMAGMGGFAYLALGHLIWHHPDLSSRSLWKKLWLGIAVLAVLGIIGGILSYEPLRHRVVSIFAFRNDSSISYRMNVYESTLRIIGHNVWVGIGPGNEVFKQVYGLYMTTGFHALGAYSLPLEVWAEQGILGFVFFALIVLTVLLQTLLVLDAPGIRLRDKLWVGLLATGLIGFWAHGLFDTIWYRPPVCLLFWFFLAGFSDRVTRVLTGNRS